MPGGAVPYEIAVELEANAAQPEGYAPVQETPETPGTTYCPHCGAPIRREGVLYCDQCGAPLPK